MQQQAAPKRLSRPALIVAVLLTAATLVASATTAFGEARSLADRDVGLWESASILFLTLVWMAGVGLVGLLLVVRRPDNRFGWLFVGLGPLLAFVVGAWGYHWPLPTDPFWAWLTNVASLLGVAVAVSGVALLFPDGRLPSPAWRAPVGLVVTVFAISATLISATPAHLLDVAPPGANPEQWAEPGIAALAPIEPLLAAGTWGGVVVLSAMAVAAVIARRRTGDVVVRAQLRWFLLAAVLVPAGMALAIAENLLGIAGEPPLGGVVVFAGFALMPIAIGIAILRYRLFDIDIVIRRTLVYGVAVSILGAVYVGLVLALQAVLSATFGGETVAVALSTLAIAALFGPVRARVRELIDRRFFRSRYDAAQTLAAFATRARDDVGLEALISVAIATAHQTVKPATVSLWLRPRDRPSR